MTTRNKIYAIVEGHGEQKAVSSLMGKILDDLQVWQLRPTSEKRIFRLDYSQFFRPPHLENALRLHKKYPDCAAVLILLDMDDGCAVEKAFALRERIAQMEPLGFSVGVVCAVREYEAWFLASLESIHPDSAPYPGDPEARRDAKGWLRKEFGYKPTTDQRPYTQNLSLDLARQGSRSFRRLYHAFEEFQHGFEQQTPLISPTRRPE